MDGTPPPQRIALVTETFLPEVNGVAMTLGRLVDGLRRRGHTVEVIRPDQGARDQPGPAEILVPGIPIPGYRGLRFGLPMHRRLREHWSRQRPDIVHVATEGPLGAAAVGAARQLALPVSSGFHTNFHAYAAHYRLGWLRSLVGGHLRRFHNRTAMTLVPTQALADELRGQGYRAVDVLARGVDTSDFHPRHRSKVLREHWGVRDDDLVACYVGRMAPEKNLALVVAAFEAIAVAAPRARLLLVGDGPSLPALRRQHPHFIYAGMQHGQALAAHYASADLFLFPSLTETFGNVVPEALASGLGIVAFDCAAAAELIQSGHNGCTVEPGNTAAFIACAQELASDPQRLAHVRRQAAPSVAHMDWEQINERFARMLIGLVTQAQAPTGVPPPHP